MDKDNSYSLNDLLEFLDFAANKGLMKRNTVNSQKAACSQILGQLEVNEKSDLRNIDLETAFQRYTNLNPSKLAPASLQSYRSRLEKAVTNFLSYRSNPANWKPIVQQRRIIAKADIEKPQKHITDQGSRIMESATKTLTLPFPIRDDLTITISNIPRDLKTSEAKRLAAFLETLAVDFKPAS